jgi:transcriptional regulator with PAS, ATPase and Fis domain
METLSFPERRRLLQLETLYDLALELPARESEEELLAEVLERLSPLLDFGAAVAVTCGPDREIRAVAQVGFPPGFLKVGPAPQDVIEIQKALEQAGGALEKRDFVFVGRRSRELLAAPLARKDPRQGFIAVLDREERGAGGAAFSVEDRRFLESVGALVGVALQGVRRVGELERMRAQLAEENLRLRHELAAFQEGELIAVSPAMRRALAVAERVAPRQLHVLVRGESGTGKERIAEWIHRHSGRRGPLVAINCGALAESLLESELFGIEAGVATGVRARKGVLEAAHRGTLFLDEVGDMPLSVQVRFLRVLEGGRFSRVGSQRTLEVDVRVVAATHRPLEQWIAEGRFREDLYYRLKGVEIELPPLRERREEIPLLVRSFLGSFCRREKLPIPKIAPEALELLLSASYPGNVRQLRHLVESAAALCEGTISPELIRGLLGSQEASFSPAVSPEPFDLAAVERRHIARVLELVKGNKSEAARLLGIDRKTLHRKGF